MEDITCCICMEVSLTMTTCNHVLCKRCYKKAQQNPLANMQACPCCRRHDYTLKDINIELNQEQKDAHYKTLLEAYNEDHTFVAPVRAGHPLQARQDRRARMDINFDAAILEGNYRVANFIRNEMEDNGWVLNGDRLHRLDELRLRDEAERQARRVRLQAAGIRLAERALAGELEEVPPQNVMNGAIVLRTLDDYAGIDRMFSARHPASARAQVRLGAGMKIGQLPFNARPMLACVGCNKKTRRVCVSCSDAYCCARCNICPNACNFHHPPNYQRL